MNEPNAITASSPLASTVQNRGQQTIDSSTFGLTAGLVITVVAIAFEALAIPTIMPSVARELGGLRDYGWVFSAFLTADVIALAVAGRHMDRVGPVRPFSVGLILFSAGLAGGGAAHSMVELIVARTIQGLGGGALGAVVYGCVARAYPVSRQPRILAMLSTAWVMPGLVGPALSGLVADHIGWRFVFFGLLPLLPVAAILTIPAIRRLPRVLYSPPST